MTLLTSSYIGISNIPRRIITNMEFDPMNPMNFGVYSKHWWKRRSKTYKYVIYKGTLQTVNYITWNDKSSQDSYTFATSNNITVDQTTGKISLVSPVNTSFTFPNTPNFISSNIGKYVTGISGRHATDELFQITNSTSWNRTSPYGDDWQYEASNVYVPYSVKELVYGDWEYMYSDNKSEYPTSDTDEYEYVYLGIPIENMIETTLIEVGLYTGTGLYSSTTTNIEFTRKPKCIIIFNTDNGNYMIVCNDVNSAISTIGKASVVWRNGSISISGSSAANQFNVASTIYKYLIII